MSAKEIYAGEQERRASRRFVIILALSILLLFALTVGAFYMIFSPRLRRKAAAKNVAAASSMAAGLSRGVKRRKTARALRRPGFILNQLRVR